MLNLLFQPSRSLRYYESIKSILFSAIDFIFVNKLQYINIKWKNEKCKLSNVKWSIKSFETILYLYPCVDVSID